MASARFLLALATLAMASFASATEVKIHQAWNLAPDQKIDGYQLPDRIWIHTLKLHLDAFEPGRNKATFAGSYLVFGGKPYSLGSNAFTGGYYWVHKIGETKNGYKLSVGIYNWISCDDAPCACPDEQPKGADVSLVFEATPDGKVDPKTVRVEGSAGGRPRYSDEERDPKEFEVRYEQDYDRL